MRFAGDYLTTDLQEQRPVVPTFNAEDQAFLPGGVQGPAQGVNTPIKNYGGRYMPDGTQPTGYRPGPRASIEGQEVAALPAIPIGAALLKGASKAYGAYQTGRLLLDGGAVNPGTKSDYNNQDPTTKYNRRKQNDYSGPASQSPYHQ